MLLLPLTALVLLSFSGFTNSKTNSGLQKASPLEQQDLTKYCGVYLSSTKDHISHTFKIFIKDNKLCRSIGSEQGSANRIMDLNFEADSLFSYSDNSARQILFFFNDNKEITGCALVKLVKKDHINYFLLEDGEYSKQQKNKK